MIYQQKIAYQIIANWYAILIPIFILYLKTMFLL
ncbi:hypothetical protein BpOF4_05225 [Alkalihalophilus pseudofirmus OF4]|uniref:Uncharacterized protein n=1 Tax=Alkalihalophilus pseudofirmus (strain ATCC BAA-2126 / JCM 17055 / OF4) TaxID=398511 RepID=D3FY84_ALKPO|nr:hypothetical protein BpOF4_05225 [Alkalihalophilus pseudofirmus OF4]